MAKNENKKKSLNQQRHHQQTPPGPSIPSPNNCKKKRRRSPQPRDDGQSENNDTSACAVSPSFVPHVIEWLEKRKKEVPNALRSSDGRDGGRASEAPFADIGAVLRLLPGLRERERRALVRHVGRRVDDDAGGSSNAKVELEGSDGEYDVRDGGGRELGVRGGGGWPARVRFSNDYEWDGAVPDDIRETYSPAGKIRRRAPRLSERVYFRRIADPNHPAHGEFGLYCALSHAPPGSWLLDYVGHVALGEDQDKLSDYVSDFGEKSELACDANNYGNEARFLNDFRNTGKHPNVEFNTRRDENGELRQGVYVKLKKDAKQEGFDGVKRDEELLVSYGKSYWRSRVGNLTDFVWRMPGRPMPAEGKPTT